MRVLFFAGREHHVLKTINVFQALRERNVEASYIISSNSLNLDPSSAFIWNYNVPSRHLHEYANLNTAEKINHTSYYSQRFSINEELNQYISPFWISHSVREAAETLILGREMFKHEEPDAFIGLHGANYWTKTLYYLAQEMGIKTYAFQEGLLRDRDQETMGKQKIAADYVDTLFTWSELDAQKYVKSGVESGVVKAIGPTHLDQYAEMRNDREQLVQLKVNVIQSFGLNISMQKPLITFAPPQLHQYKGNFEEDIKTLAAYVNSLGAELIIRLHPFNYSSVDSVKKIVKHYDVEFYTNADAIPLIAVSDLIVSQHSTMAVESFMLGKLFAEIDLSNAGILQSFADRGLAIGIGKGELNKIEEALNGNPDVDLDTLNEWLRVNANLVDGRATERAVNIITGV